jgi:hypothetical protein
VFAVGAALERAAAFEALPQIRAGRPSPGELRSPTSPASGRGVTA